GAVGDGVTDDTEAIQKAFSNTGLIYFPNGIYLISDTIKPPQRPGGVPSRRIIQGQSRDRVIIRLRDRAPGFDNPAQPKPMIVTSWRIAQAFRNAVRDVTIDLGAGNPGAVGLEFFASNTGHVWNVTIRSSDPENTGFAGLAMFGDNGPLLVRGLNVQGCEYGIISDCNQLATFEHITLSGQRRVGLESRNKSIIRALISWNSVPAVVARGQGFTLLEARLFHPASSDSPAIELVDSVATLLRDIEVKGYATSLKAPGTTLHESQISEWTSKPVYRLTTTAPSSTLRLPIEETPEFDSEPVEQWVPITRFAPSELWVERKGRHRKENWATALQSAIDSGA
uniref:glycosyl hydrolase family 28-related protein n=1 Tax=Thermogutta sp. TaxID=1962930 RepID=UPI0032205EA6